MSSISPYPGQERLDAGHQAGVIKSFNEQVGLIRSLQEKQPEAKIRVSLCSFNDAYIFIFWARRPKPGKTQITRLPAWFGTALYDAIGQTWHRVTAEAKPHHKLFFAVFTDGLENASKEFTAEMVSRSLNGAGPRGGSSLLLQVRGAPALQDPVQTV